MRGLFITGTDTGVGKTVVACGILRDLIADGVRAGDPDARVVLGLDQPLRFRGITEAHRAYLPWHRERVFQTGGA